MDTRQSTRRQVQYASFDEVLADAERVVRARAATTGKWSLDQILGHLAIAMEKSIDGFPGELPWFVRLPARCFLKPWILKRGMKAGFKLPAEAENWAIPPVGDANLALEQLRRAIGRLRGEKTRSPHPMFGSMTAAEWDRLHLRHAELHMSFVREP